MANRLGSLPASDDEYWEGAEVNKLSMPDSPKCEHFFVRTKGNHVECKCGAGYFLSPGFELKEGHIYKGKDLVI